MPTPLKNSLPGPASPTQPALTLVRRVRYQLHWEQELGLPWENAEGWEKISPFNDVAHCTTPTLIVCGAVDWNVPVCAASQSHTVVLPLIYQPSETGVTCLVAQVQNSDQLYQALKRLGVETELVVYPDQHHGITLPSFERDRYERWLQWFDKYTKA